MDLTVVAYVIYLLISVALTVWVARTLSRNGKVFLADVLHGNEKLADAVNHLLVVGFYLVNLGFVTLYLKNSDAVADARGLFEALSVKVGVVLLVLGVMHLGNVYVLNKIRRRGLMEREQTPPVPPQGWTGPRPRPVGRTRHRAVTGQSRPRRRAAAPVDASPCCTTPSARSASIVRHWLMKQRQLVPLDLVPAASEEARHRFPGLDHAGTLSRDHRDRRPGAGLPRRPPPGSSASGRWPNTGPRPTGCHAGGPAVRPGVGAGRREVAVGHGRALRARGRGLPGPGPPG